MSTRIGGADQHAANASRRSVPWVIAATVLVVVVWAAIALRPRATRVAVIGDSITVFARDAVDRSFDGSDRLDIRAEMGRRIDEMLPSLEAALRAHPHVVVVNLGTNDVLQAQTHPNWRTGFNRMIALVADVPCAGLTTISTLVQGPTAVPSVANDINAAITNAVHEHRNFHVVDWNAAVHAPGGMSLLIPDHVHPTGLGSVRLAGLVHDLVDRTCS
jgi:hypothetical protein